MPEYDFGPTIKDDRTYKALRDKGYSKEKSARIANAGPSSNVKGGKSQKYEEWTRDELYSKAQEIGLEGRSKMNKKELIKALRNN